MKGHIMDRRTGYDINLIHMLHNALSHWRCIIVIALVFAVAVPGLKYYSDISADKEIMEIHNDPEKAISNSISANQLTDEEVGDVNELVNYALLNERNKEYIRGSVILSIDPYREAVSIKTYYLKLTDIEEVGSGSITDQNTNVGTYLRNVFVLYENVFYSDDVVRELIDATGLTLTLQEFKTLFSVSLGDGRYTSEGVFSFSLINCEGMKVEAVFDKIDEIIERVMPDYQYVAKHELIAGDCITKTTRDDLFAETQFKLLNSISEKDADIQAKKNRLSDEQQNYYDTLFEIKQPTPIKEKRISVVFAAAGFVLGAFLTFAFFVLYYIVSGKFFDSESYLFADKTSYIISLKKKKNKKTFGFIDRLIDKIFGVNPVDSEDDQKIKFAIESVALSCKKEGIDKVALVSSIQKYEGGEMVDRLISGLSERGITLKYVGNILADADALAEFTDTAFAYSVEKEGTSKLRLMNAVEITAEKYDVKMLGLMVI